jgi:tetratricopeptide (TPR) repeat protein
MGAFEARLKANARLRWLVPAVAGGAAVVALAAWMLLSRGVDPDAQRRHAESMALAALDDLESLEKSSKGLEELSRHRTGIESVDADLALSRQLLATGLLEDVAAQADRLSRKLAERDRVTAAQPPPVPETVAELSAEVEALRGQVEPRQVRARALSEQAYAALKKLSGERGGDVAVSRGLALYFASIGDREQALRFLRASPGAVDRDPWLQLAEGWLDAREEGKEARERGVTKLAALVAAHPEIVRARFLLAKAQAGLGRKEQAAATLAGLLAANPAHHRSSRLQAELVGPAAAPQAPAPAGAARPLPSPGVAPPSGSAPTPGAAPAPAPVVRPVGVAPAAPAPAPAAVPAARPAVGGAPVAPASAPVPPVAGQPAAPRPAVPAAPTARPPAAPSAPTPGGTKPAPAAPAAPAPAPAPQPAPATAPATAPAAAPPPRPAPRPAPPPEIQDPI